MAENVLIWRNLLFHSGFMLWCLIDSVAFAGVSMAQVVLLAVVAAFVGLKTVLDDLKQEVDWSPKGEREFVAAQIVH